MQARVAGQKLGEDSFEVSFIDLLLFTQLTFRRAQGFRFGVLKAGFD